MYIFQCSVTCGKGWRKRSVQCVGRKFRCDYRNQPDVYTMCDMGSCPVWRAGRWSEVTRVSNLFCRSALELSGPSARYLSPVTVAWSDEDYFLSIANLFCGAIKLFKTTKEFTLYTSSIQATMSLFSSVLSVLWEWENRADSRMFWRKWQVWQQNKATSHKKL